MNLKIVVLLFELSTFLNYLKHTLGILKHAIIEYIKKQQRDKNLKEACY